MEERLTEIWQKALGRDTVGVNQNFFDAGGDSLRLIQVRAGVREMLGADISVADLFRYPTIAGLATRLGASAGKDSEGGMKAEAGERAAKRRTARVRRVGR
jgi:aryl carrier-like protein